MFDLSFGEILLVALVAIVFIGPKDMPVVLRAVARWLGQLKSLAGEFRKAFDDLAGESGLDEVEGEMRKITGDDGQLYDAYDISEVTQNLSSPRMRGSGASRGMHEIPAQGGDDE